MKKLNLLSILLILLLFVSVACESDDDDDNDTHLTMTAQQMANAVSGGVVDATEEIIEVTDYADGFEPESPNLLREILDINSGPTYDDVSGWWTYDTSSSYMAMSWAVSESLQYQDESGAHVMLPEEAHLFIWRNHYEMVQAGNTWNYVYRIEYSGMDIEEVGEDHSYIDGTGTWTYDISRAEGDEEFTVNIIYSDIILHWVDGVCDPYPQSGEYQITYGDWSAFSLVFDGDETAIMTITDLDSVEWVFIVNLDTGEVVLSET